MKRGMALNKRQIINIIKNGGATLDPNSMTDIPINNGYIISLEGFETKLPLPKLKYNKINKTLKTYRQLAIENGTFIGLWVYDKKLYFDLSIYVLDISTAKQLAKLNNQLSIYDCSTKNSFFIGGE